MSAKIILLGTSEGMRFVAAADRHLVVLEGAEGARFLDQQDAEALRDFLLEHYPLPATPERK